MVNLNDLTSNSEVGSNGRYLVKSKKKEDALKASTQVWTGGSIIVVSYDAVNYVKITDGSHTFSQLASEGGATTVTSNDITDATTVGKSVLTAVSTLAARTAIGAGTSNLIIGTTSTTAKVGTYVPTYTEVTGKPATFPPTIGTTATTAMAGNAKPATAGAADTAITLVTGRTFSLAGGATGTSAAFNGSANATIAVTLATPTAVIKGGVLLQPAIADIAIAPTAADFNAVLAALRLAGILTP